MRAFRCLVVLVIAAAGLSACGDDTVPTAAAVAPTAVATPSPTAVPTPAPTPCTTHPAAVVTKDVFCESVKLQPKTSDGLQYGDIVVGTGPTPQQGETVTVQYTGWLADGTVFDSSRDPGRTPFQVTYGTGVIQGWTEGLATMRAGGKRRLIIPPALGYSTAGQGSIPPNATLYFDIQVISITG